MGSQSSKKQHLQQQLLQQNIACPLNDCANGGLCYRVLRLDGRLDANAQCKCRLGYAGPKCELVRMVHYAYEDAYLEFEPPDLETSFNLTLRMRTTAEHGLLLYHGSKAAKQHLAVELFKGRIRVSLDLHGNNNAAPLSTMFSYVKLNDGVARRVQLTLSGQNLTLRVEEADEERMLRNEGPRAYLSVGFGEPLYVGGVPNSVKERISRELGHVRNASSFAGCLADVYLNGQLVDLQRAEYSHKVAPGCLFEEACFREEIIGERHG